MSLDFGFSKALLLRWASGSANTILLTGRGHGSTTAGDLLAKMKARDAKAVRKVEVAAEMAAAGGAGMVGGGRVGTSSFGAVGVGVGMDEEVEEDGETPLFVGVKVREGGTGGGKGGGALEALALMRMTRFCSPTFRLWDRR